MISVALCIGTGVFRWKEKQLVVLGVVSAPLVKCHMDQPWVVLCIGGYNVSHYFVEREVTARFRNVGDDFTSFVQIPDGSTVGDSLHWRLQCKSFVCSRRNTGAVTAGFRSTKKKIWNPDWGSGVMSYLIEKRKIVQDVSCFAVRAVYRGSMDIARETCWIFVE